MKKKKTCLGIKRKVLNSFYFDLIKNILGYNTAQYKKYNN